MVAQPHGNGPMHPSDRSFWVGLTLWGGVATTVFGYGIYALIERAYPWGIPLTAIGFVLMLTLGAYLTNRLRPIFRIFGALALIFTWIAISYQVRYGSTANPTVEEIATAVVNKIKTANSAASLPHNGPSRAISELVSDISISVDPIDDIENRAIITLHSETKVAGPRLRILIEYSYFGIFSAPVNMNVSSLPEWSAPERLLLLDARDYYKGQPISAAVIRRHRSRANGTWETRFGGETVSDTSPFFYQTKKYKMRILFIDGSGREQIYNFYVAPIPGNLPLVITQDDWHNFTQWKGDQ